MTRLFKKKTFWIISSLCLFILVILLAGYFIYFRKFHYHNTSYTFKTTPISSLETPKDSSFTPIVPTVLPVSATSLKKDQRVQLLRDGYFVDAKDMALSKLLEESKYPVTMDDANIGQLLKGMETDIRIKMRDEVLVSKMSSFWQKFDGAIKDLESKAYKYPKDFNEELQRNKEWGNNKVFNFENMSQVQLQNFKYIISEYGLQTQVEEILSLLAYVEDEKGTKCAASLKDTYKMGEIDKENLSKGFETLKNAMNFDKKTFDTEIKDIESGNPAFLIKYSCYVTGNFNRVVVDSNGELYSRIVDIKYTPAEISSNNFSEPYDYPPVAQYPGTVRVPIFMYHQITAVPASATGYAIGLYVTPEMFEQQMAYLVSKNYKAITPKELYDLLAKGKNPPQKSVMITFDDGSYGEYQNAYPILKKYGMVGVFYIPSFKSSISKAQLKEMSDNGMIIDSHSRTHPNLQKETNVTKLTEEIAYSKADIGSFTGVPSLSIAYPGCVAGPEALNIVASSGYLIGVSCGRGIDHSFGNRLVLSRVHVFNDMKSFKKLLSGIN